MFAARAAYTVPVILMEHRRKAPTKQAWIGPACAAAVLVVRLTLPGAVSALRGVLIDSRGEKLSRTVFEAFTGRSGSVQVLAPAAQEDREPESSPDPETGNRAEDGTQEQTEETADDRS